MAVFQKVKNASASLSPAATINLPKYIMKTNWKRGKKRASTSFSHLIFLLVLLWSIYKTTFMFSS